MVKVACMTATAKPKVVLRIERDYSSPAPVTDNTPQTLSQGQAEAVERGSISVAELLEITRGGYAECCRFSVAVFDNPGQSPVPPAPLPAAAEGQPVLTVDPKTDINALLPYQIDLAKVRDIVWEVNLIYWRAERICWQNVRDSCLLCLSCYILPLMGWRKRTYYAKHMRRLDRLIETQNRQLFNPCGLQLINPRLTGDLYLEIQELKPSKT